ncbi:MAG: TadE/TadG family type IV pilus assembly protein [Pseudomonadota bacterium]
MRRNFALMDFARNRSGNVAMMFGLLVVPLLIGAGIGLDMVRANEVRARLAEGADAGVLAAARARLLDDSMTDEAATALARRHFEANAKLRPDTHIDTFEFIFDKVAGKFTIAITGTVKTTLLAVAGRKTMPLNITSEAKVAPPRVLEAVLVLDNTNSMNGAKMTALKASATELVDTIMADTDNTVKVGIVPFSAYVNVGKSRRSESWMNVPTDYSTTKYVCGNTYPDITYSNCHEVTSTCTSDGVSYSCTSTKCDINYGTPVVVCSNQTYTYTWYGCAGSRNYPLNVKDEDFATNPVPGLPNYSCTAEVLPLTVNKAAVKSKISSLYVQGDTYIPSGLTWGLRLISADAPFTEGTSYADLESDAGVKAIILMTDGANTRSPTYPTHTGWDASLANTLTTELCDEIKSKKIFIHTIAFEVTDTTIQNLLRNCASDPSDFYDAGDEAELAAAFNSIGDDLQRLALTR